jgi:hypothetical protein
MPLYGCYLEEEPFRRLEDATETARELLESEAGQPNAPEWFAVFQHRDVDGFYIFASQEYRGDETAGPEFREVTKVFAT